MKLKDRMVAVLRKIESGNTLAVDKVFVFPRSKTAYRVTVTGAVVRVIPKPWRNRAEQKRWKKARRLARAKAEI